jgi:uncharacterized membrane protein YqhA
MNLEKIFVARYVSIVAVISSLLGAVVMFLVGAAKTAKAVFVFVTGTFGGEITDSSDTAMVTILIVRAVDAFLLGMFLIIFAYSVYVMFLRGKTENPIDQMFRDLQVTNISQLKNTLAHVVIIILFVLFLERMVMGLTTRLSLEELILPVSILCLGAGLRLMRDD